MAYTHTNYSTLKTQLSARLGDASQVFWVDTEIGLYIQEAMRTFGLASGFWRDRGVVSLSSGTVFYDLTTALSGSLLTSTITDRDIIQQVQYALLESTSTQASWPGTAQFTYADVTNALSRRRDQFLADTGIILTRSTPAIAAPPIGRQTLADNIIDVRRAAWQGASPLNYYSTLWRSDERELTSADSSWSVTAGTPTAFSVMATQPVVLQLAPAPVISGTLDLLTVNTGPTLNPASSATALGIPDDLTPALKWGVLADLLGIDGQARDPSRAAFCEARYRQYVDLARMLSCVITAEINGVPCIPDTLANLDAAVPAWQDISDMPAYPVLAGWNMLAVYPVPDGVYSVTLDVVRKANVPSVNSDLVQLGREQLDMILDYAEHLALFKVGGTEFAVTERQATNFLTQSVTYNQRLSSAAKYIFAAKETGQREKSYRPRRQQADGLGALPSVEEAQSFVAGNAPVRMRRG